MVTINSILRDYLEYLVMFHIPRRMDFGPLMLQMVCPGHEGGLFNNSIILIKSKLISSKFMTSPLTANPFGHWLRNKHELNYDFHCALLFISIL